MRSRHAQGGEVAGMQKRRGVGRRAQSTLEYILVLAAILVAAIVGANTLIRPAVNQSMTDSGDTIKAATGKVKAGLGLP